MNKEDLDKELLAAHEANDISTLSRLYGDAADWAEAAGDIRAASFYLTHAYVFALQKGLASAQDLHSRLKAMGREE